MHFSLRVIIGKRLVAMISQYKLAMPGETKLSMTTMCNCIWINKKRSADCNKSMYVPISQERRKERQWKILHHCGNLICKQNDPASDTEGAGMMLVAGTTY